MTASFPTAQVASEGGVVDSGGHGTSAGATLIQVEAHEMNPAPAIAGRMMIASVAVPKITSTVTPASAILPMPLIAARLATASPLDPGERCSLRLPINDWAPPYKPTPRAASGPSTAPGMLCPMNAMPALSSQSASCGSPLCSIAV